MKLTVIGGCGSRSLMLAKSLAKQATRLSINEVIFMDVDVERVKIFGGLVKEIFNRIAPEVVYTSTTDPLNAVKNADFIITTIRAGKEDGRIIDETIALKHGVIGQETTGIGGFAMALRSVSALLEYCRLIKEHAKPDVMVFNFTNPAGLVTQALRDKGYDFVYGICDAPSGFLRQVAGLYGKKVEDFQVRLAGLNHLSYFTSVKINGEERMSEIIENPKLYTKTDMRYFEPDLVTHYGCLINEYLYYFYYREKALANMQQGGETRGQRIRDINESMIAELRFFNPETDFEKMLEIYSRFTFIRESNYMQGETSVARDLDSIPRFDLDSEDEGGYAAVALALMKAKITGEKGEMLLCVPNGKTLPFLEETDIIEVSCDISAGGATAKPGNYELPESVIELIKIVKYYERTAARAIINRDAKQAIDAVMLHPLVSSYSLAKEIVMDYLKVYDEYVGGWETWVK